MDYRLLWILVRLMKDEKVAEAKFRHPHILQCAFCGIFHPLIKMMAEAPDINYFILVAEAKIFRNVSPPFASATNLFKGILVISIFATAISNA